MKRTLLAALCFLMTSIAYGVSPFSLPWMNHPDSGTLYYSSDHPSAVFVIEAYYLNCPYCHDNAPKVDALAEKYADEPRVQVLDVGIDRYDSYYESWINKHNPNHPVLKDDRQKVIRQLGTTGYPSTYVLDCKGNVHYKTSGVWNTSKKRAIENMIDGLLTENCNSMVNLPHILDE